MSKDLLVQRNNTNILVKYAVKRKKSVDLKGKINRQVTNLDQKKNLKKNESMHNLSYSCGAFHRLPEWERVNANEYRVNPIDHLCPIIKCLS